MSPMSSPFVPCILVPRSQMSSVKADMVIVAVIPPSYSRLHTCRVSVSIDRDHGGKGAGKNLMIDDIVASFVNTLSIGTRLEGFRDILDIQHIRVNNVSCPLNRKGQILCLREIWNIHSRVRVPRCLTEARHRSSSPTRRNPSHTRNRGSA